MSTKNNQHYYPEVVVAGMPSCGKTVFLTVLAKKFTNQIIGSESTPLGFRMETVDRGTLEVVDVAYKCLQEGKWPLATTEGQIMPLRWSVYTEQRHVFDLTSMDLAGETFRKAFDIQDGDGSLSKARTQKLDVEIFSGVDGSEERSARGKEGAGKELDEAVQKLTEAVKAAKVFCFMVNIDLPDSSNGSSLDEKEKTLLNRFKSAVQIMYFALRDNAELRAKTIIVLSQAYRYQGAIDLAGGPALYLGKVCGQYGAELCNLVLTNKIPVLTVSAINETGGNDNELPKIQIPDDIPSSGLFSFLLVVAGSVAKEDALSKVKDAYLDFQRERVEYLKFPSLPVGRRFAQAKKLQKAAKAFVDACNSYLDDLKKFMADNSAFPLSQGSLENLKRSTQRSPEVQCALDDVYFKRDELWDRALRKAAVALWSPQTNRNMGPIVLDIVQKGLQKAFPGRMGNVANLEFLYGFGVKDLAFGSNAQSLVQWIDINIREYRRGFDEAVNDLDLFGQWFTEIVRKLSTLVKDARFDQEYDRVIESYDELAKKLTHFWSYWLNDGAFSFPELDRFLQKLNVAVAHIDKAAEDHNAHMEKRPRSAQE